MFSEISFVYSIRSPNPYIILERITNKMQFITPKKIKISETYQSSLNEMQAITIAAITDNIATMVPSNEMILEFFFMDKYEQKGSSVSSWVLFVNSILMSPCINNQKVRQPKLPHRKTPTPIVVTQILYFMGINTPFQDREFAFLPYAKSILKCRDEKGYSFPI